MWYRGFRAEQMPEALRGFLAGTITKNAQEFESLQRQLAQANQDNDSKRVWQIYSKMAEHMQPSHPMGFITGGCGGAQILVKEKLFKL